MLLAFVALLGLHHVDVRGRFVAPNGTPAAGIRIDIGDGAAQAITGPDGRFVLTDVNSGSGAAKWYETDQWLPGWLPPRDASATSIDYGDIRLEPNSIVRVHLPGREKDEFSIVLHERREGGGAVVAERIGTYYVLRNIAFADSELEILCLNRTGHYRQPIQVKRGRRDQLFTITFRPGAMDVRESTLPPYPAMPSRRALGRVIAPNGEPIPNVLVTVPGGVVTSTGPTGNFDLSYRADLPQEPEAVLCDGAYSAWERAGNLRLREGARYPFRINGQQARAPWTAHWRHPSRGWQPLPSLTPWLPARTAWASPLRLSAPGRMPLALLLPYDAPPVADFQDGPGTRTLTVNTDAFVDVEWIADLAANKRFPLETYRVRANGKLTLEGAPGQLVEVFVYAKGFEPAHSIWLPNKPLTLTLRPRTTPPPPGPPARITVHHPPGWKVGPYTSVVFSTVTKLTIPEPGKTLLAAWPPDGDFYVSRSVTVRPDEHLEISIPPTTASLSGPMPSLPEPGPHGYGGPRVFLLADAVDAWSVVIPFPPDGSPGRYRVPNLPAGNYHLFHHMLMKAPPAYGGTPVRLIAGRDTVAEPFNAYLPSAVPVEVAGVDTATVRILDPMRNRVPFPGPYDPLPIPPAIRLSGGKGVLPSIRPGVLELVVELDDGRRVPFRVTVRPSQPIRLILPSEAQSLRQ